MTNDRNEKQNTSLGGTTIRVYRLLYRSGSPMTIHDIQRSLGLSSSSVAVYHIKKLLDMGLVKQDEEAHYYVDRVIFENMIRIRRSVIPIQSGFIALFGLVLILLLFLFRPLVITSQYVFSVIFIGLACAIFVYQTYQASRKRI